MSKIIEVGMRISGDAAGAQGAIGATRADLGTLSTEANRIKLLDGDSVGAAQVLGEIDAVRKELAALAATEQRIALFDAIIASADRAKNELVQAQAQVNRLKATLSEAYDSGADNSLIRSLEKQLATAEKAAARAEQAVQKSTTEIVRLNLEADKTGVSVGNLAQKKNELAEASARLRQNTTELAAALDKERQYQAYLADETERLAVAEKHAKETRFVEETRQSAIQAQKAAEYTAWWGREIALTEAKAGKLNAAFSTIGIRSAAKINADILGINSSLLQLATRANVSGSEFDRAFAEGQKRIAALRAELKGVPGEVDHVANKADRLTSMMKGLAGSFAGIELARQFVTVSMALENTERSFIAITGSTRKAAQEMEYARVVADRLGVDLLATSRAYADLMASTKGTASEGKATRDVFESVTRSMAIAGRSSAEASGALNALSQMANKGVVQMEELRGQLGDRLPGALKATADGLGITTAQLFKLIDSGRLTADELFPALAAGLNKLYANAAPDETLSQKWAHFKNSVVDSVDTVSKAGGLNLLKVGLEGLETIVVTLSVGFVALGKDIGAFFAALASGDIGWKGFSAQAKQAFTEIEKEAQDKLVRVAMHNGVMAAALDEAGKKALAAAKAAEKSGSAAEQSGNAADSAAGKWTRLNVEYGESAEKAEAAAKQAQANADAKKAETDAVIASANAFGTEIQKLIAKADASRANAVATGQLAAKRQEELAVIKSHLAALELEANAQGPAGEARQKVIDDLKKTVDARQADADKAKGQAQASAVAAAQAETEANAHADNSGRLVELKAAYEQATLAADVLRSQKAAGIDVGNALSDAEIRAGKAVKLYQDALADQTAQIQRNLSIKESQIGVDQAVIRLAIEQQRSIVDVARARGDERGAIEALLKIKRLEIQLAELTAAAKAAEAAASLELVKADRARLEALGALNAAQEAELKAREAGAKVKQIEGQIASETAKRMRDLLDVTRDSGNVAGDAAIGHDRFAGSLDRVTTSANTARESLSSYQQMVAKGMSQSEIQNRLSDQNTNDTEKSAGIVKRNVSTDAIDHNKLAASYGLFGDVAEIFGQKFKEQVEREMAALQDRFRGYASSGETIDPQTYRLFFNGAMQRAAGIAASQAQGWKSMQQQPQDGQSTRHVVELRTPGGRSQTVDVAGSGDANNLASFLSQLELSKSRSNIV